MDIKEMVPRLGPERADFMLNEEKVQKNYVCLYPSLKNSGVLHCMFLVPSAPVILP